MSGFDYNVGDVNSDERGSGARANAGKPELHLVPLPLLEGTARVFMYGRSKYAEWNWAKGMAWSICFGCCLRHAQAALRDERAIDPDSGESHWGHFLCNLIMLDWYVDHYPEGDDRPLFRRADGPGMGL